METWQIEKLTFEGYAPQQNGEAGTAWEFTATVGGRGYSVYLVVENRILRRVAGIPPQGPPPAELIPRLLTYMRRRLEHPITRDRYPASLRGALITINMKAEWAELVEGDSLPPISQSF